MKKTYKLTLKVKGANVEFSKGMGIGVLGTQEVTLDLSDRNAKLFLAGALQDHGRALIDDCVEVEYEEVKNDQT